MADISRGDLKPVHPLHAILLAFPFPLFLAALLSDWAYWSSFHIQWSNFAQWLIAGALVGGGFALLWALIDLVRVGRVHGVRANAGVTIYFTLLLVMWVLGFINALVHAKDAWATMPAGLWLSVIVTLLALAASWVGFSRLRNSGLRGEVQ